MSGIERFTSGAPWERIAGYCRVVRADNHFWVAGTTAVDGNGEIVGRDDPERQTAFVLDKIIAALKSAGAEKTDIVRTRLFVTDITHWEAIAQTHGQYFSEHPPVCTLLAVDALIDPDMLVEIEAEAFVIRQSNE